MKAPSRIAIAGIVVLSATVLSLMYSKPTAGQDRLRSSGGGETSADYVDVVDAFGPVPVPSNYDSASTDQSRNIVRESFPDIGTVAQRSATQETADQATTGRRSTRGRMDALRRDIDRAAANLANAANGSQSGQTKQQLAAMLKEYFQLDMQIREHEVRQIEERLAKLKAGLEKRRTNRQRIIDLQMQVYETEAAGMGLFRNGSRGASGFFGIDAGQNNSNAARALYRYNYYGGDRTTRGSSTTGNPADRSGEESGYGSGDAPAASDSSVDGLSSGSSSGSNEEPATNDDEAAADAVFDFDSSLGG